MTSSAQNGTHPKHPSQRMRDSEGRGSTPHERLLTCALRGVSFLSHPSFQNTSFHDCTIDLESLAFRLRPLLMTAGDDADIWSRADDYEALGGSPLLTSVLRGEISQWYALGWAALGPLPDPPTWGGEGDDPITWMTDFTPNELFWDFAYGYGVHSDQRRVLRHAIRTLGHAPQAEWLNQVLLRVVHRAYPIVDEATRAFATMASREQIPLSLDLSPR